MNTHSLALCFFLLLLLLLLLSCHTLTSSTTTTEEEDNSDFVRPINRKSLDLRKREKLSHFKLYWHSIMGGQSPTSVTVVPPAQNNSTTFFGSVHMIDNPLTLGPDLSSKLLGKAQGFYASASQNDVALLMAMNFAFIKGKYTGSTITILGRNRVFNKVREMPVVGGSGLFRFARGYAKVRTHSSDVKSGDGVFEYKVYVFHY